LLKLGWKKGANREHLSRHEASKRCLVFGQQGQRFPYLELRFRRAEVA
jgi:hypothetical protein